MKILYHHRIASRDGQSVHVDELIHALRAAGHEVVVVSPGAVGDDIGASSRLIAWMKRHLPRAVYELMELAYSVPAFLRLWRTARRIRPDIIYERYNLFLLAGLWLKRMTGLPLFLEVNAPLKDERVAYGGLALTGLAARCDRAVWSGADRVLPVSDVLAGYIRRAGVPEERICIIHNGINRSRFPAGASGTEARRELGLDEQVVLGFTGFVRSWHRLETVIPLLADRPDAALLVIGDGPARADIEAAADAAGVSERVRFLGFVERDRIAGYVAAFDIALQPSVVAYASPLKIFEYMALGRAIVAPDQPNIREILDHERTACLFDPDDPRGLITAVSTLLSDEEMRRKLGQAASAEIEARGLTWQANAGRIMTMAEEILARRHRPAQPARKSARRPAP